jgi:hypothetical protein
MIPVVNKRRSCALLMVLLAGWGSAEAAPWRGWPPPRTQDFIITEVGLYSQAGIPVFGGSRLLLTGDVGYMQNLDPKRAVGGTFVLVSDDVGWRYGLSPRLRLWLTPGEKGAPLSLDLAPAVFISGVTNQDTYRFPASYALTASLNFGDLVALSGRVEATRLHQTGTDWAKYGGVRVGSFLAPVAAAAGLVVAVIAISALTI